MRSKYAPVLAMDAPLDGVPFVVENEENGFQPELDHSRNLLHGQLAAPGLSAQRHTEIDITHMLPSPMNRIVLPRPRSRAAIAAPRVLPNNPSLISCKTRPVSGNAHQLPTRYYPTGSG